MGCAYVLYCHSTDVEWEMQATKPSDENTDRLSKSDVAFLETFSHYTSLKFHAHMFTVSEIC